MIKIKIHKNKPLKENAFTDVEAEIKRIVPNNKWKLYLTKVSKRAMEEDDREYQEQYLLANVAGIVSYMWREIPPTRALRNIESIELQVTDLSNFMPGDFPEQLIVKEYHNRAISWPPHNSKELEDPWTILEDIMSLKDISRIIKVTYTGVWDDENENPNANRNSARLVALSVVSIMDKDPQYFIQDI